VLAAGFDTPLLRAYLMFGAGLAGYAAGRESGAFQGLLLSALALLLLRPYSLFDASFQMSFLAAYSVTAGLGAWRPALENMPRAARWALGLFLVSFFAQAVLAPALAWYFHRLSLVSPFSNLLLVPLSGALMFAGFALSAFEGVPGLGWASAWSVSALSGAFLWLVRFFAGLDFSAVAVRTPTAIQISGWVLLCFVLLHLPLFRSRRLPVVLASAGVLLLAAGFFMPGRAGAVAFRLGEGGAAILSAAGRSSVIVSSGYGGEELAGAALASGFVLPRAALLTCGETACAESLGELAAAGGLSSAYMPSWSSAGALAAAGSAAAAPVWPGDTFAEGGYQISALWADGQSGYSGPGDRLAYRFKRGETCFIAGPGGTLEEQK